MKSLPSPLERTRRPAPAGRGFTLTELLIVIVIIIILVSILLPAVGGARNSARRAATESFMSSIHNAVGQFRAAEQRIPGYFTVKDVGSPLNFIDDPSAKGPLGLSYGENMLLDLAGGIAPQDEQGSTSFTSFGLDDSPSLIRVGVSSNIGDDNTHVNVVPGNIGSEDGPGYLDVPEGFIDMGGPTDGRAGTWLSHKWMPRLVDSWGMPILFWPRDEFAKRRLPLVERWFTGDSNASSAAFYWAGNSAFFNAPRLGKGTQKSQWDNSALSIYKSTPGRVQDSLAAVIGHPAFPDTTTLNAEPMPMEPRGDVILQSAGIDGIYLEKRNQGKSDELHTYSYLPDSFKVPDNASWAERSNFLDESDDLVSAGS